MTGPKTNERPGVRAQHRHAGMSATKARAVLDLIRGKSVAEARTILQFSDRGAAEPVAKVLDSAVANAANNNDIPPEELFVATAYADEGPTLKRWRPRARGRATRIRKRTCHITIIVGRYSVEEFDRIRSRGRGGGGGGVVRRPGRAGPGARGGARQWGGAEGAGATAEDAAAEEAHDAEATEAVVRDSSAESATEGNDTVEPTDAENAADEVATEAVVAEDSAEVAEDAAVEESPDDGDAEAAEKKDED